MTQHPNPDGGVEAVTPDEMAVLMQMSGDLGYPAAEISANLAFERPDEQWTPRKVSDVRRSLHAKGYADFGPLYSEDDGLLRGRGYWLSRAGCDIRYGRTEA